MGLDMYLYLKKSEYHGAHDSLEENLEAAPSDRIREMMREFLCGSRSCEESFTIGYWRKANAVHKWFVDHCADGTDDCREMRVSTEKLIELRETCLRALTDRDHAGEILPPSDGFYFGSTEIDEDYFDDINRTYEIIDKTIKAITELDEIEESKSHDERKAWYDVIYQASW